MHALHVMQRYKFTLKFNKFYVNSLSHWLKQLKFYFQYLLRENKKKTLHSFLLNFKLRQECQKKYFHFFFLFNIKFGVFLPLKIKMKERKKKKKRNEMKK